MTSTRSSGPIPPDRLSRLLVLLQYLLDDARPPEIRLEEIERDLDMSPTEVAADLSLLNLVNHGGGTYLLYASVDEGIVSVSRETLSDTYRRPARLSPQLAKALRLAMDMLQSTMAGHGLPSLAGIREKLEVALRSEREAGDVEIRDSVPADEAVTEAVRAAVSDRLVLRIEYYTASRDELSRRTIEPHYLVHGGPGWYLEAFCRNASGPRTFRMDRIRSAEPTGETFDPREDLPLEPRPASPQDWREARIARIRLPEEQRPYLEEEGLRVETAPPDSIVTELPFTDHDWLVRQILRYRGRAVLETPPDLRPVVVRIAEELRDRYI